MSTAALVTEAADGEASLEEEADGDDRRLQEASLSADRLHVRAGGRGWTRGP